MSTEPPYVEIGKRVRAVRMALGFTSSANLAEAWDISRWALETYESGRRAPSIEFLDILWQKCGVSADYILYGRGQQMPHELMRKIEEIQSQAGWYRPTRGIKARKSS